MIYLVLLFLLLASPAHAATLLWEVQPSGGGPLTIERSTAPTGPFTAVATVPQGTTSFIMTPGLWGHYRVRNSVGPSNTVQYSLDLYSGGLTDRLDLIEARVSVLESAPTAPASTPTPTSNFTITPIDADHVRLVCNGIGITTTGSGTTRILECRH